eukprot:10915477-Karenia_brevis.AAC.1
MQSRTCKSGNEGPVLKLSNKRLLRAAPRQALRPSFEIVLVMIATLKIMTMKRGTDGGMTMIMIMIGVATGTQI